MNSFKDRLQEALNKSGLSQAELARRAGIGRNSISDYLKGKYEAKQDKLHALALALNVDEAWLMGYDVTSKRKNKNNHTKKTADLADEDTVFTYEGRQIPPEDLEYMKRILRGGK